jgi:hypothetical protein
MLHYRFEAEFCNRGKGNEKGATENKVGYTRRNWYVPYPQTDGFEGLTAEIYKQAIEDLERPHYKKGVLISELWAEEKTALLPLPEDPFEPVEFQNVKVNKYGKVTVDQESYALPGARIGETVLAKLWWDKVEMLDQNQKCLATFPRPYTLKSKPIDWPGHFAIFVHKPKGARNSTLYRLLPPAVKSYLEADPEAFGERIIDETTAGKGEDFLFRQLRDYCKVEIPETFDPGETRCFKPPLLLVRVSCLDLVAQASGQKGRIAFISVCSVFDQLRIYLAHSR